jgi:hypothetical protein
LKGIHPCGTGLIVRGLALPEMLVEIDIGRGDPGRRVGPLRRGYFFCGGNAASSLGPISFSNWRIISFSGSGRRTPAGR